MDALNISERSMLSLSGSARSLSTSEHSTHIPLPPLEESPNSPCGVDLFPEQNDKSRDSSMKSSTSDSSSPQTKKKKVHFFKKVRVRDTISRHDMTLKEHYDCWFHDKEYAAIGVRNQKTVQEFERQSKIARKKKQDLKTEDILDAIKDEDFCLRGLEGSLKKENIRKRFVREDATYQVLLEQADQVRWGIEDVYAIADVYCEANHLCLVRAMAQGLRDRKDIEDYLQDKLEAPKEVEKKKRRGRRPENRRHISKSKGQSKKKSRLQKNSARLCRVLA